MPPGAELVERVRALAALPGVGERLAAAREACTSLRFEEALRRRMPEAAAESRVRGAWASAALDGAELPVEVVRDVMRGAQAWSARPDPVEQVARGAVQATAESEHVVRTVLRAPLQAMARLHVAAAAGLLAPEQVGRPRTGTETARDLVDLGPPPAADRAGPRLAALADLVAVTGRPGVSGLVVASLVHAEVATVRPFVLGNGAVARAVERAVVQACGLDPTGVAVLEVGHRAGGLAGYVGALGAYGTGSKEGVTLWLQHCADAVVAGAAEGARICAAVRTGRLG